MNHTLLTFTPLSDPRDVPVRAPDCTSLSAVVGPLALCSFDENGWLVWEYKLSLVNGQYLQLAQVINDEVMPADSCYDVLTRANAIKISVETVTERPGSRTLKLEPFGSNPVDPQNHSARFSFGAVANQPIPVIQIGSTRHNYMTNGEVATVDIFGTIDTRPGRNSKLAIGNTVIVWAEQNAVLLEWPAS